MATQGDVVMLTLEGSYLTQQWSNVCFYMLRDTPTPGYLTGLGTTFLSDVVSVQAAFANTYCVFGRIRMLNLFTGDENDMAITPVVLGARTATSDTALPSFVAGSIKLTRSNRNVRHGSKRIVGGLDLDVSNDYWTSLSFGLLEDVANAYASELVAGAGVDIFDPVIVGRVEVSPGRYRLPVSALEMGDNWAKVISGQVNRRVSTQRSRLAPSTY